MLCSVALGNEFTGLLTFSTVDIWGRIDSLLGEGRTVLCRMFSSAPGLSHWMPTAQPLPSPVMTNINVSQHCEISRGWRGGGGGLSPGCEPLLACSLIYSSIYLLIHSLAHFCIFGNYLPRNDYGPGIFLGSGNVMEATVHEGYSKVGNTGSNQITTQTLTNWGKCPESSDYGSRQTKEPHLDGGSRGLMEV